MWKSKTKPKDRQVSELLSAHFGSSDPNQLSIFQRTFPVRIRADLQRAINQILADGSGNRMLNFCGVHLQHSLTGLQLGQLLAANPNNNNPPLITPPEYEEIDIGEDQPVRCVSTGLWLLETAGERYAVLISSAGRIPEPKNIGVQIAARRSEAGTRVTDKFLRQLEVSVNDCRSYRGKILSLEQQRSYTGQSSGIRVHRLPAVQRNQVILPEKTLQLLERNVMQFVRSRDAIRKAGLSTKKGLLFYGPPGTGKSLTIRYLAGALQGHTMLLITAEQAGLLDEYMALARLLQPSIVVVEDVDLIARDRNQTYGSREQILLNKLLNEMDGLRQDCDVLFILTTNRPEELERALTARPGRVDQAIEFPLPDESGREKLVRLYACGAKLDDEVVAATVKRTEEMSGAFIKELMRRALQFHIEHKRDSAIEMQDVLSGLDEMLFTGGSLNAKLLWSASNHRIKGFE